MNYISTKVVESKTQDGARIVLKRVNERHRQALHELQAPIVAKLKTLLDEWGPLDEERRKAVEKARAGRQEHVNCPLCGVKLDEGQRKAVEKAQAANAPGAFEFSDEKLQRWATLGDQIARIQRGELEPVANRYVVVRIEDFEVDGEPIETLEALEVSEAAPDDFRAEITRVVKREIGLLPDEVENLSSPSTSAAAVDGGSLSGSAALVETPETTTGASAGSSTDQASAPA